MQTQQLFSQSTELLKQIYHAPFTMGVSQGTLPRKAFKFYVEQHVLYLQNYAKNLIVLSERFKNNSFIAEQLHTLADETMNHEHEIHHHFLHATRAFTFYTPIPPNKIPLIHEYTNFLQHITKEGDLNAAFAAITASPWVYLQMGRHLEREKNTIITHVSEYKAWIQTYKPNAPFERMVDGLKRSLSDLITDIPESSKKAERITQAFMMPVAFECRFFAIAGQFAPMMKESGATLIQENQP